MARHRGRMATLERERERVAALPAGRLSQDAAERAAAATRVQAAWRGWRTRLELEQARAAAGAPPPPPLPRCASPGGAPLASASVAAFPFSCAAEQQRREQQQQQQQAGRGSGAPASTSAQTCSAAAAPGAPPLPWRRVDHMPEARYRQLMARIDQSIDARVRAAKLGLRPLPGHAPAPHGGCSTRSSGGGGGGGSGGLDQRLAALQEERAADAAARLAAVRCRQALLQQAVRSGRAGRGGQGLGSELCCQTCPPTPHLCPCLPCPRLRQPRRC
jgi:hypothetical protein